MKFYTPLIAVLALGLVGCRGYMPNEQAGQYNSISGQRLSAQRTTPTETFVPVSEDAAPEISYAEVASVLPEMHLPISTLWDKRATAGQGKKALNLRPAIDPFFVYSVDYEGQVVAQDIETGETVWRQRLKVPASVGPVISENLLFVGTRDGRLLALDIQNGELKWQTNTSSVVLARPIADEQMVYVATIDGQLSAYSRITGDKRWAIENATPALTLRGGSQPVIVGETLFVGTSDGKVVAVAKETGVVFWDRVISAPTGRSEVERMVDIIADLGAENDKSVLVAAYQGRVASINPLNSLVQWQQDLSVYQDFSHNGEGIYITTDDGTIYGLERLVLSCGSKMLWPI